MDIGFLEIGVITLITFGGFFAFIIHRDNDPAKLKQEAKDLAYDIQIIDNELLSDNLTEPRITQLKKVKCEKQAHLDRVIFQLRNNQSDWSLIDDKEEVKPITPKLDNNKSLGALMNEMSNEIRHMYVPQNDIEYTPSGHLYIGCTDQAIINSSLLVEERERVIVALCKKQASVERALKNPNCKDKVKMMELLHTYQIRINEQVKLLKEYTHADNVEINMDAKTDDNVIHYNFASK